MTEEQHLEFLIKHFYAVRAKRHEIEKEIFPRLVEAGECTIEEEELEKKIIELGGSVEEDTEFFL